jgi:hypothetical protein
MKKILLATLTTLAVSAAHAVSPIPEEPGFSGFVNLGAGGARIKSNTLAKLLGNDIGDDSINSLTKSPGEQNTTLPAIAFELSYTFGTGTQIFAGQLLEDFVRFDSSTRAGVRQSLGGAGIMSAALLTTPIKTKVWKDPYQTGGRTSTPRSATGIRLAWGEIFGTGLEVRYAFRDMEVDDEESGSALVASGDILAQQQRLLKRDADITNLDVRYQFRMGEGNSLLLGVTYKENDADGDAEYYDGYVGNVSWIKMTGNWRFVTNLSYGQFEADKDNPVYDKAADFDQYGASFATFYANPFGWEGWNANAGIAYGLEDNDIDFLENEVTMITAGMLYMF